MTQSYKDAILFVVFRGFYLFIHLFDWLFIFLLCWTIFVCLRLTRSNQYTLMPTVHLFFLKNRALLRTRIVSLQPCSESWPVQMVTCQFMSLLTTTPSDNSYFCTICLLWRKIHWKSGHSRKPLEFRLTAPMTPSLFPSISSQVYCWACARCGDVCAAVSIVGMEM